MRERRGGLSHAHRLLRVSCVLFAQCVLLSCYTRSIINPDPYKIFNSTNSNLRTKTLSMSSLARCCVCVYMFHARGDASVSPPYSTLNAAGNPERTPCKGRRKRPHPALP